MSVGLAVGMTWPLARHLDNSTPSEHRDARLTVWILAWDAHVLGGDPTDLFQSPMFHPERDTLAYTDHMIGLGAFAAPVSWITEDPYVAHNVVFILGFAFAAFAAFLAAFELTASRAAGAVGAVAYAFAPYWASHDMHIQVVASGWIPFTLWAFTRWWRSGNLGWIVAASLGYLMAALTSWYQAAFLLVALLVLAVVWFVRERPANVRRLLAHAALGGAIAAAGILPFAIPYLRVQRTHPGFGRQFSEVRTHSASPTSFLSAPASNVVWGSATRTWSSDRSVEVALFPGLVTVALATIGVVDMRRGDRSLRAGLLGLVGAGVILAFGAGPGGIRRMLPWAWLAETPVFGALRAAGRAHVLTVFGLAMLAAFGARAIAERARGRGWLVATVLVGLVLVEGAAVPLALGAAPVPRAIDRRIAATAGAVLELPMDVRYEADALLYGTAHWRPMANGRAGYTPASWKQLEEASRHPADPTFLALLRERGITTVIVDSDRLAPEARGMPAALAGAAGVRLIDREGSVLVYEVA